MALITDISALKRRLSIFNPEDSVLVADFDATLAEKKAEDYHNAYVTAEHGAVLHRTSDTFRASVILTARGEASTINGLYQNYGKVFDLTIASESGHEVLFSTLDMNAPRFRLPLVDKIAQENLDTTRINIYKLLQKYADFYGSPDIKIANDAVVLPLGGDKRLTIDPRKHCGAVIFENFTAEDVAIFKAFFKQIKDELGAEGDHIKGDPKMEELAGKPGFYSGYVDLKPVGMSKETIQKIFRHAHFNAAFRTGWPPAHVMTMGDTAPDLKAVEAAYLDHGKMVTPIWIGNDPAAKHFTDKYPHIDVYQISGQQKSAIGESFNVLGGFVDRKLPGMASRKEQQSSAVLQKRLAVG